jgi:hypothetical protein
MQVCAAESHLIQMIFIEDVVPFVRQRGGLVVVRSSTFRWCPI